MAGNYIELKFKDQVPNENQLVIINEALQNIDYDIPSINKGGICEGYWRKPLVSLQAVLSLLHRAGFPCEGKEIDSEIFFDIGQSFHSFPTITSEKDYTFIKPEDINIWKETVLNNDAFIKSNNEENP